MYKMWLGVVIGWSCHWKMEQEEMIEFFRSLADKDVHTFTDIGVQQKRRTESFRMTKSN